MGARIYFPYMNSVLVIKYHLVMHY